jgi:hypothetical protein
VELWSCQGEGLPTVNTWVAFPSRLRLLMLLHTGSSLRKEVSLMFWSEAEAAKHHC